MGKGVSIVGLGMGWEYTPINDNDIWGITHAALKGLPFDLIIDMNAYDDLRWGKKQESLNNKVLRKCRVDDIPYVCLDNYPIKEIIEHFDTDYFNSTIDYAIALAILRGYVSIDLYGVNLVHGSEYEYQKPGASFWCGYAKGRDIDIKVHGKMSVLMKTKDGLVYGYDVKQGDKNGFCAYS